MVYNFSFFLLYSFFIRKGSLRENPYFFLFSSFFLFTSISFPSIAVLSYLLFTNKGQCNVYQIDFAK